jgi:hypothetical protein
MNIFLKFIGCALLLLGIGGLLGALATWDIQVKSPLDYLFVKFASNVAQIIGGSALFFHRRSSGTGKSEE